MQRHEAEALLPFGFRQVREAPQGKTVRIRGIIRPTGFGLFRPSGYRLVDRLYYSGGTTAYMISDDIRLSRMVGQRVEISGFRFWLHGVRQPVIVVESVRVSR